jgi:hypothetical protein
MIEILQDSTKNQSSQQRNRFTEIEDQLIKDTFSEMGSKCWKELGILLKRKPKQIRDRYNHYLKEPLITDRWSTEEDQLLTNLMKGELKGKWVLMEQFLKGRNQIQIKNRWRKLCSSQENQFQPDNLNSNSKLSSQSKFYPPDFLSTNFCFSQPFQQSSDHFSQSYYENFYPTEKIKLHTLPNQDESIFPLSSLLNRPIQIDREERQFQPIHTFS